MPENPRRPLDSTAWSPSETVAAGGSSGSAPTNPAPKRTKKDGSDSESDSSGDEQDGEASVNSSSKSGQPGKGSATRLSMRKEKKSAREKARRQRENALFEELATMCNVPADTRDKSSVLKAVIKRVEELRGKNGFIPGGRLADALPGFALPGIPGLSEMKVSSAYSSVPTSQQQPTVDDLLLAASRGGWGVPAAAQPPPPPPPPPSQVSAGTYGGNHLYPQSFPGMNASATTGAGSANFQMPQTSSSFGFMNSSGTVNPQQQVFPNKGLVFSHLTTPSNSGMGYQQQQQHPKEIQLPYLPQASGSAYGAPAGTMAPAMNISPSNAAAGISNNMKMFIPDFLLQRSEANDVSNRRS